VHPPHTFEGIVKSQIIRRKQICTGDSDFNEAYVPNYVLGPEETGVFLYSFLRKIKRDTLYSLGSEGQSNNCGKPRCKICKYIATSDGIINRNGKQIALNDKMNCQ